MYKFIFLKTHVHSFINHNPILQLNTKTMKMKLLSVLILLITTAMVLPNESNISGYSVGDIASDFQLKNASNTLNGIGETVSLNDYKNAKGFIIVFTCNHCPFSKAYEDRINALHKKYSPYGYPVVAINPNDEQTYPSDSYAEMKNRAKEKNFAFAYLRDETQAIAKTYGASKTPHVYVLEKKNNKNYVRYIGAIDDNTYNHYDVKETYVEDAVNALIAGKVIQKSYTRAVGCSIKWKE